MPLWSMLIIVFSQMQIRRKFTDSDDPFFIIAFSIPILAGIVLLKKKEKRIGLYCLLLGIFVLLASIILPLFSSVSGPSRSPKAIQKHIQQKNSTDGVPPQI